MQNTEPSDQALTPQERHLLSRILNEGNSSLTFELSYLVPSGIVVGLGVYHASNAAFVSAFAIIATFRAWQVRSDLRNAPVFRTMLRKLCTRAGDPLGEGAK
jgi:hypothetical protein